ncbi:unnamed protein product [Cuscuta epithymum]|uniref:DUF3615 domain-containing protein n=1 Tax=Cuscuta epithymum TaxID=186058 RepID=A0AAV0EC90_9ASTE|nr:unnamed protein product [Cuscuta epithymum]CAH9118917.1 unnamed protein product [Cuscuta epithymum]
MNRERMGKAKLKGGGVSGHPEDVRSKALRKRTGTENLKESVIKPGKHRGRGRAKGSTSGRIGPLHQLVYVSNGWAACMTRQCALAALSSINEKQDLKYELVEPQGCIYCPTLSNLRFFYHCNFVARPENGSEADDTLFFAELEGEKEKKTGCQITLTLLFYHILGPCGSEETDPQDCEFCAALPDFVKHPQSGDFNKFVEPGAVLPRARVK